MHLQDKKATRPRARTALPATAAQAALPLADPEVIEIEATDQLGQEMLDEDDSADPDELHDALLAFAEAPEENDVREYASIISCLVICMHAQIL